MMITLKCIQVGSVWFRGVFIFNFCFIKWELGQ